MANLTCTTQTHLDLFQNGRHKVVVETQSRSVNFYKNTTKKEQATKKDLS